MNWSHTSLKILGLTQTEIAVLNVLQVPRAVQNISRLSRVSRTGVNHVLEKLKDKGLVSYEVVGKRRLYKCIHLEELARVFQQASDQIQVSWANKKGARIKLSKEDEFIIHVGAKEIIPAYKRIAAENKNERIRAIQHHRSWSQLVEKISPKQLIEFNEAIKTNHIILEGMLNVSAYDSYKREVRDNPEKHVEAIKSLEGRMADYAVFPDNFFNYDAEIWIFKTTTLIINWKEEVAIEITNANMTGFLKDMFAFVKESGKKLDHNETVRTIL